MAFSRSALDFIRRKGLLDESLQPAPRLNVTDLKVHTYPLGGSPRPAQSVLRDFEGDPAPDRNISRPWPRPED